MPRLFACLLLLAAVCAAAGKPSTDPADAKAARAAFDRGVEFHNQQQLDLALEQFERAWHLEPANSDYAVAGAITREQLVSAHLRSGNDLLLAGQRVPALAEFRAALELDPGNAFARQRMSDALDEYAPERIRQLQVVAESNEVEIEPAEGVRSFHYRGDAHGLYEFIGRAFDLDVAFDASFPQGSVKFDVDNADFITAVGLAGQATRTFWTAVTDHQILVAADTTDMRRQMEHSSQRTFYLPGAAPGEITEVVNVFRTMFDIRFIVPSASQSLITVRAPKPVLDAATDWLERLDPSRPQVLLDINAYEVDRTVMRNFGVNLPLQFQIFNIPSSALDILKLPNVQDAIQKIIANGGLTPANLQAIQALLAQFQSLQGSPFLAQNFFAVGGGLTLFGVQVSPVTIIASLNDSRVSHLQHVTLRAAQGSATTFHIGDRYPVITSSFSAAAANPQLSAVLPSATGTPLPTFSYEDLGISLKATPQVFTHDLPASDLPASDREDAVGLQLEMNVRALTGQSFNGVPLISNREYRGAIQLRDGEPAVITSMVSFNESSSLSGLPGFSYAPLLSTLSSTKNKQRSETQIMLVITPHILRARESGALNEQWIPRAH